MVFNAPETFKAGFENQLLAKLGEYINYYDYTETYDSDGYLTERDEPAATRVKAIIATFTQKDIVEYDLGNVGVDDHKAFVPDSVTPAERDEVERMDGERYEVIRILHEHAIAGTKTCYTLHIRRRRNVS